MSLLIQGLKQYEAVLVGESIVLQLAETNYHSSKDYLIDGEPRNISSAQITLNKDSTIKKIIKVPRKVVGVNLVDGSYVDYQTYSSERDKYDVDGEPEYPTLEEEYQHKKLMQTYQGSQWVYEETPDTYEDIQINIVGEVADTGCPHITNALALGQGKFNNSGYYRANLKGVVAATLDKFAKEYELTTHQSSDSIEYVQMVGSYVFNSSFKYNSDLKNSGGYRVVTTLQAAKEVVYQVEHDTWQYLSLKYSTNLKVTPTSASVIHGKIASIQNRVISLEVKTKSDGTHRLLKKEIVELQDALYSIIKGESN